MASGAKGAAVRQLERLYTTGGVSGLTEDQLLDRFVARNDEAAFEAIVARHGPMVLSVCRRWLRDPNDVDDAFQATFLVLVRKAGSLRQRGLLGNWLYGVAYKVAVRARTDSARRQAMEKNVKSDLAVSTEASKTDPELDEEIHRLPEKYRAPIVLCYLEGRTHDEAAVQLRWPVGTVKGRLARARDLLKSRLSRRGVTVASSVVIGEMLARDASASVVLSEKLVSLTVRVAALVAKNKSTAAAAGILSAKAVSLSEGVIQLMSLSKLKMLAVTFAVTGTMLSGASLYAYQQGSEPNPQAAKVENPAQSKGFTATLTSNPAPSSASKAATQPQPAAPATSSGASIPVGSMGGGGMAGGMSGVAAIDTENLRIKIAQLGPRIAAHDKSAKTKEIVTKLELTIEMRFGAETPIEDVLKYIKTATEGPNYKGIPIYVDPTGLAEAEKTMASPITMDLEGVPLKTTLRLLLKQIGLAYCVRDGVLIISSVEGIHQELMEAQSENPDPEEEARVKRGFQ